MERIISINTADINKEKWFRLYVHLKSVGKKFLNEEGVLALEVLGDLLEDKTLDEEIKKNLSVVNIDSDDLREMQEYITKIFIKKGLTLEEALVILKHIPNFLIANSKLEIMS